MNDLLNNEENDIFISYSEDYEMGYKEALHLVKNEILKNYKGEKIIDIRKVLSIIDKAFDSFNETKELMEESMTL